jgi:hypothetical protein
MLFDIERVRENVREATTEDLLDRATVYRSGMEPKALEVIENELRQRGVTEEKVREHENQRRQEIEILPDGTARKCSLCHRPAVAEGWGWHWLWGKVPVFPRFYYYCSDHQPPVARPDESDEESLGRP